ncbi:PIN domain-like protein, partial [Auricularia subglabra TFB-10046 SS5]
MGVPGLWDVLRPAARTQSLSQLAVTQGFEGNTGGHRGFRIGIDASIWFFHAQVFNGKAFSKGDVGENPEIRTLFFRCAKLMSLPLLPLFVFDGPQRPKWKRGKRISKHKDSWLVGAMQNIIQAFGYECIHAHGEAEAELAYLNRIGVIDAVLTDDVDTFLFGATMIIRKCVVVDGNHVNCYKADDLRTHEDIMLTQGGLILIGLMRGGDYHQAGVQGIGVGIARGLAECGFGDQLVEAVRTLKGDALETFLDQWRSDIVHELRTNSRGIIGKKHAKLASTFPIDFPDLKVVDAYVNPVISEKKGVFHDIEWRREPDLTLLAKLCEQHFEWGYAEAILKRFRTIVWPGMVCRILRRSILLADDAATAAEKRYTVNGTPTKARAVLAQGTPSKMITQYFSQLDINSPVHKPFDAPDATPLIVKIHSERKHASTDGLREFRLEIAPLQLARLAEQGLLGTRSKPEANPYLEDEDDDEVDDDEGQGGKKKKTRKPKEPVAPDTIMRVWMPACMVELVEPRLVRDYEDVQERKRLKKEGKATAAPRQRKAAGDAKPKAAAAARKPAASK